MLVLKVWVCTSSQFFLHPRLKSQLVETIVDNGVQSEDFYTIHYTHNETLEWSSCSETSARTQTHTMLALKAWVCTTKSILSYIS